jgi:glyoxylase-like metal-dependent hydrolase (beta-lactamase superfamily II)/rhodanese-related sulfurtransferase
MLFRQLFDGATWTYTYLLADPAAREAVLIDPVIEQVERDATLLAELELRLVYTLDTHVHADHVTGAGMLGRRLGAKSILSERSGSPWADVLVKHGDMIRFGGCALEVRETPGHTSGCLTYVTSDRAMAFTGDALLVRGCGRTDFQQGDPRLLYRSIHEQIFSLPDETLIYPGHDYKGRTVSTVREEKRFNARLGGGKSEEAFVEIMNHLELAKPARIDQAVPANLLCGLSPSEIVTGEPTPSATWAPIERTSANVPEVTAAWSERNAGAVRIVDVREADEFKGPLGHPRGAELVPLARLQEAARGWDREHPMVIVCRSGGRSGKAALLLEAQGFKRVASLRGGMTAWNEAGLPVER